jgi:hypothetical protein
VPDTLVPYLHTAFSGRFGSDLSCGGGRGGSGGRGGGSNADTEPLMMMEEDDFAALLDEVMDETGESV